MTKPDGTPRNVDEWMVWKRAGKRGALGGRENARYCGGVWIADRVYFRFQSFFFFFFFFDARSFMSVCGLGRRGRMSNRGGRKGLGEEGATPGSGVREK